MLSKRAAVCWTLYFCTACSSSEPSPAGPSGGASGSNAAGTGNAGNGGAGDAGTGLPGAGRAGEAIGGSGNGGAAGSAVAGDSGATPPGGTGGTSTQAGATGGGAQAGAPSGGAPAGGGGQAGASDSLFIPAWQDEFDTFDAAAWQLQTFTFEGNQAQFSTENATVANGVLKISLTAAPTGAAKPYLGVEMRSTKTLTYGKVSARMRFAAGSGVVSGLVLFYIPYPNCDWNEIDIEHLGKSTNSSQVNAQVFLGTPDPNCTTSVAATQEPQIVDLGFNAETDFHLYDIEWTPAGVKYFADGNLLRTWTTHIDRLKLPETILLTIWASNSASWAGALTDTSAPTSAEVDWIKVYDYNAAAAGMGAP
jgi:hypothetical protein